ncbi:hypothetical protein INF37_02050 [Pseudoflavonifractor sp. DSM 107456]|uniref:Tail fiber protein n=1 Tax=Pseudoflavonifractor gallinarum TaxID=2779352 RepID=A0ABR9R8Z6_9FIRM|nr:hypothetical protein [Pseudoflavonifractor gallinarum]MBE5054788.1 hypothetical protein [Pseudoflavonifractor gallinarum]
MAHTTEIMVNGILTQVTEFDHSAQDIDDAVDALNGAKTPQEALANLGAGVRPSRIVNGGFKENQRGKNSYTGAWNYCFDGWVLSSNMTIEKSGNGDIVVSNTSASENGYLIQRIESPLFDVVSTFSVVTNEGVFCATGNMNSVSHDGFSESTSFGSVSVEWDSSWQYVSIGLRAGQSITFPTSKGVVAKFEDGLNQTLAYQKSDGTLEPIPQPDSKPGQILAECQRYIYSPFYGAFPTAPIGTVFVSNQTTGFVVVKTPVLMRTKPVFSGDPSKLWIVKSNGGGAQRPSALSVMGMSGCGVFLSVTASFEDGGQYIMYSEDISNPSDFLLSAEL